MDRERHCGRCIRVQIDQVDLVGDVDGPGIVSYKSRAVLVFLCFLESFRG